MTNEATLTAAPTVPEVNVPKKKKKNKISRRENNWHGWAFIGPYALIFSIFILVPVILAMILSFTNFNAIQFPKFVGFLNYITILTNDEVFMKYVLPNTVVYAVVVGIGGYVLSFVLAWALCNLTKPVRTIFALILYSPSMTTGVAMTVLWKVIFSGDQAGLLNSWLMELGVINEPVIWLTDARFLLPIVIVTVLTVGLSLLLTTMLAFALAKIKFKGRNLLTQINQIAIMFVSTAVLIPRYLVVCKLGLINNLWAHVLPLVAMPVALFLVKQFVEQVPDSLLQAAYMDGATDLHVYIKVILPMIKPAIATASILVFQQVWTNMETSNYFFQNDSMKTLTFYMNTLVNANNSVAGQGMGAAASLIMFLPNLILFIILQNKVMNTMASSGIK